MLPGMKKSLTGSRSLWSRESHSPKTRVKRGKTASRLTPTVLNAKQPVGADIPSEMCGQANHQGIACRSGEVSIMEFEDLIKGLPSGGPALIVLLDHIQDPHNLGAIVRSAEACGAKGVVFPRRRGALPGGAVVKVSAGAALRLPMAGVTNIARTVEQLQEAGF